MRLRRVFAAVLISAGLLVAGCGGSGDTTVTNSDRVVEMPATTPGYQSNGPLGKPDDGAGGGATGQKSPGKSPDLAGGGGAVATFPGVTELGRELGAEVGVAVGPVGAGGPSAAGGDLTSGSAWSTIKVPISLRVVKDAKGPAGLTQSQRDLISRAITLSDNEAAAELFAELEATYGGLDAASKAVQGELRAAGDEETVVSTVGRDGFSTYGQTEWSLAEQERFVAALAGGCVADDPTTDYLLGEMGQVTADPWGLGSAGVPAKWKGGWGPGTDGRYLLRQMGVVRIGGRDIAVSIAVRPSDGSFETGQTDATELAEFVAKRAGGLVGPSPGC